MPQQRGRAHLPLPKTSNNGPFSNSASPSPCVPCRTAPHKGLYTTSHRDPVVSGTSLGGVVGQHHHWIGGAHVHSSHRPGSWESSPPSAPLRMEGHTRCRSKRLERGTGVRGRYKRRIGLCVRKDSAPPPLPPASSAPLRNSDALRVCITSSCRPPSAPPRTYKLQPPTHPHPHTTHTGPYRPKTNTMENNMHVAVGSVDELLRLLPPSPLC